MKYELRADGALHIEGYVNAVERDSKTVVCPECGKCVEQIQAGAFGEALRAADNVDLLLNHNRSRRLGSTAEGNLSLCEDNIGLRATADITDSEVIEKARHGLLRGWSFGFKALKTDIEQRAKSVPRRHVKSLAIFEVSLIDDTKQPCYAGTSIEMRGGDGETVIETREFTEGISPAELEKQYKKLLRWRDITKRCVYHGLAKPQLFFKACEEVRAFEMRYNPNHDEHGRFTFGDGHASGGYVHYVPKGQKGNGQMMFVVAGDTMAQNDALWNSLYGEKSQNSLTNSANSGKIEETVDENQLSLDDVKAVGENKEPTIAGAKKGNPMTPKEADSGNVNPGIETANYYDAEGRLYYTNCQTCVVAYEARLRGYDVEARPKNTQTAFDLSHDSTLAWIDPATGEPPEKKHVYKAGLTTGKPTTTPNKVYAELDAMVGSGQRYTLNYNNKGDKESGHIVNLYKDNLGNLVIKDNQRKTTEVSEYKGKKEITAYIKNNVATSKYMGKSTYAVWATRVDNADFNYDVVNAVLKSK